ncbi:MAG: nucleotidyltransferase substrate binding protein, partial [Hydrogenothermaceae bacterium]
EKYVEVLIYFFKTLEIYLYGQASETLRKRFEKMEKLGLISDIELYMDARLLRNRIAHTYTPEKLEYIYSSVEKFSNTFINDFEKIERFIKEEEIC